MKTAAQAGPAQKRPPKPNHPTKPFAVMSEIIPKNVEWLWENRIALGEITIIDGDPGTNKSSLLLDLAARVSTGRRIPDDTKGTLGGVVLLAGEDSIRKTLPLRLKKAVADMSKVGVFTEALTIPNDIELIEETLYRFGAKLLVIDPLMAFLGGDSNSDQSVRRALTPLRAIAERTNVAIVLVRHLNKGGGRQLFIVAAAAWNRRCHTLRLSRRERPSGLEYASSLPCEE